MGAGDVVKPLIIGRFLAIINLFQKKLPLMLAYPVTMLPSVMRMFA